jgi:STAS domain
LSEAPKVEISPAVDSELRLSMTATGTQRWLVLDGDLDSHTSPALKRCLDALADETVTDVVMDLTPVRRFDDAAVAVLLEAVDGPWVLRWRRPADDTVAAALAEALLTDFFVAVDTALTRAEVAKRLRVEFETLDDLSAPRPTSVVWVARRHDNGEGSAKEG